MVYYTIIYYDILYYAILYYAILAGLREMGGAPRNPAPGNHFLVWIVKPSG